jgi:encore-like protein
MKESASPPRTPSSHSPNEMKSHSPTAPALNTSSTSVINSSDETSSPQLLAAPPTFVLPQSEANNPSGKSQLDIEFPKLTPPKTKVGWNAASGNSSGGGNRNNRKSVSSDTSSNNNSLCEESNESHDKSTQHQPKTGSQTISVATSMSSPQQQQQQQQNKAMNAIAMDNNSECEKSESDERVIISPSRAQCKSPNYTHHNDNNNNNNNNNCDKVVTQHQQQHQQVSPYPINVKGKPPLKNMGSSSSCEGGNTSSGFISRDSSSEQFLDQNGIDLVQFFRETLNKNAKDRNMLMKIERDLLQLAVDQT